MTITGVHGAPEKHDGFFVPKTPGNPSISAGERALWCAVVYQALSESEYFVKRWIGSSD